MMRPHRRTGARNPEWDAQVAKLSREELVERLREAERWIDNLHSIAHRGTPHDLEEDCPKPFLEGAGGRASCASGKLADQLAELARLRGDRNPGFVAGGFEKWSGSLVRRGKCAGPEKCIACDRIGYHVTPVCCAVCKKPIAADTVTPENMAAAEKSPPNYPWICSSECMLGAGLAGPKAIGLETPAPSAICPIPTWMQEQVERYYEWVELLILAFIAKHGERPKLFTDDQPELGQMVAFVDPRHMADDGEPLNPKLRALALERAPEWKARTKDLDPDNAIVAMIAAPEEVRIRVEPRTEEFEAALAARAATVLDLLKQAPRRA